ncbi:MAG: histidine kinase [Flavobacteriales bacterium]|nr:histidine kinase [Flavobacteriales bacterium]
MDQRRKTVLYWTVQVLSWGSYVGLFLVWNYLNRSISPLLVQVSGMVFLLGLVTSHLLRALILRRGWLGRPIAELLPRLFASAVGLGVLVTLVESIVRELWPGTSSTMLSGPLVDLFSHWLNWSVLLLLWSFSYLAYHYFARIRKEEIRSLRLETLDRENQLQNLRAQLNPHFMFNALNGIRALIDEDPEQAKRAITQLSAILRNAMTTVKRKVVPLGEEVDIVKAYLALESMRYEERLRVSMDIDRGTEREQVPPMLLQTLVENAVRHGIAKRKEGGDLHIAARGREDGLELLVRNSGSYVPGRINGTGIGLKNTRKRLQLLYGGSASLEIAQYGNEVLTRVVVPRIAEPTSEPRTEP